MDTNTIRSRLQGLNWKLIEIPIRKSDLDPQKRTVVRYKIIAVKGDQSHEIFGNTLDEAIRNIGSHLGVIPKE